MDAATQFATAPTAPKATRKGPRPVCEVYGPGDVAIFHVLHERRANGETWVQVQTVLDSILGIKNPIHKDKFRYHWSGGCSHWDGIELPQ